MFNTDSLGVDFYVEVIQGVFFPSALSIACFVLECWGLYTIAKRRGIHKPWLAWIPSVNGWILGCISDQYQYMVKGKVTNRRKILLGLSIITGIAGFIIFVLAMALVIWVQLADAGIVLGGSDGFAFVSYLKNSLWWVIGLGGAVSVLSIIRTILYYMSYYDLYHSCDPANGTLYLVLSILIRSVQPFLLFFACRNKDDGMPLRPNSTI